MRNLGIIIALVFTLGAQADLDGFGQESVSMGKSLSHAGDDVTPELAKAIVKTLFTPLGNKIQFFGETMSAVQTTGYEAVVDALADTKSCGEEAGHLGESSACILDLGGEVGFVMVTLVSDIGGNLVYWVTETVKDMSYIWADLFMSCAQTIKEERWPRFLKPCTAVAITVSLAGQLISAAGIVVQKTISALGSDLGSLVIDIISIPTNVLRGDLLMAASSFSHAAKDIVCVVGDILLIFPRALSAVGFREDPGICLDHL